MHYLRPKSLAPEEILFSETGEPCSFLTVKLFIGGCDKTLHESTSVCASDSERGGRKRASQSYSFLSVHVVGSVKTNVEVCDGRDAHGRIKQVRGETKEVNAIAREEGWRKE